MSDFVKMQEHAAFARCASFTITHPLKKGYAIINVAYPATGHGERPLTVFVVDAFGAGDRTCTSGTARGYGYDKLTAALVGLSVDGVEFTDHCAIDTYAARMLKRARSGTPTLELLKGKGRAYDFANWSDTGPTSCYRKSGMDVLRALGYVIIQGV